MVFSTMKDNVTTEHWFCHRKKNYINVGDNGENSINKFLKIFNIIPLFIYSQDNYDFSFKKIIDTFCRF